MATETTEKAVAPKKPEEKFKPSDYWCDIILEKTTQEKALDRSLPTDAFNVTYVVEGETRLDVTRSEKMANVFDMYYDKYGPGSVKSINYGHGTIRPNLCNVKPPERKKRKRRLREDE